MTFREFLVMAWRGRDTGRGLLMVVPLLVMLCLGVVFLCVSVSCLLIGWLTGEGALLAAGGWLAGAACLAFLGTRLAQRW